MSTSLANNQYIIEIDSVDLLLHGIGISMNSRGLSVPHRAMVGILTYDASRIAYLSYLNNII
jgi:hypothetical protein